MLFSNLTVAILFYSLVPGYIIAFQRLDKKSIEVISKLGFWVKITAGPRCNPQEYISISRI